MPASLVSWAAKASSDGSISRSPMTEERKTLENVFTTFTNTLEVLTSWWNYIGEMYSNIQQGEQETTDQLDQCIKILVEKCGCVSTEEKTRHRLELLFHATKHFEVGKIANSSKRNSHLRQAIAACKATRGNHQGLSQTQVQWRSCNVYHNQRDQNLHKKRPGMSG